MSSADYGAVGVQNRTRTLFGQVMWAVAATAGLFALGAYLGRDLGNGMAFVFYILAFVCLIGMRFAIRSSAGLGMALLFGVGLLMGLGTSPMLTYYAEADPQALWEAGAATALFVAGCGAFGYATRTDLSGIARVGFWALLALIGFGVVLIFVHIPGGAVIYSILRLVIFAGLTMVDFQRLRRSTDMDSAPLHRRIDLPGCTQRVPVLPAAVRRQGPRLRSVSLSGPAAVDRITGAGDGGGRIASQEDRECADVLRTGVAGHRLLFCHELLFGLFN